MTSFSYQHTSAKEYNPRSQSFKIRLSPLSFYPNKLILIPHPLKVKTRLTITLLLYIAGTLHDKNFQSPRNILLIATAELNFPLLSYYTISRNVSFYVLQFSMSLNHVTQFSKDESLSDINVWEIYPKQAQKRQRVFFLLKLTYIGGRILLFLSFIRG